MVFEKEKLQELLAGKGIKDTEGLQSFLGEITKEVIESLYEGEVKDHLGYERYSQENKAGSNRRNGYTSKTVTSAVGDISLSVPRDREGSFEPIIVKKRQKDITGMEEKVISLYGLGMSTRNIQEHIKELYHYEMSPQTVSTITDTVIERAREWQNRPLEEIYPIVFMDALVVKIRKDRSVKKVAVYGLIGIDIEGNKECLGLYISENAESSRYWANVLSEIKNRGVKDILIFCVDNLTGISEAIESVFPHSEIQKCIVHQIRNSLSKVSWKERKQVAADLKLIYQAPTEQAGVLALENFEEKWDSKFPHISKSWRRNWSELSVFFKYTEDVRKLIYTTNPIESFNRNMRKISKNRPVFEDDDSIMKLFYLGVGNLQKKWTQKIRNWGCIFSQLVLQFGERLEPYI